MKSKILFKGIRIFGDMELNTVIFDMDGLLIDSEPLWQEAGIEVLSQYGVSLTLEQYHQSTGLRTREWIEYWFHFFSIDLRFARNAEDLIIRLAIEKIRDRAHPMAGVDYIFSFFRERNFRIGLATSSPLDLVDVVTEKLRISEYLDAVSSAESLRFGKPNPEVYLQCAEMLKASPLSCICFEDSFNGMIAAKAARMKCVVIPAPEQYELKKWGAADHKLGSLSDFGESML